MLKTVNSSFLPRPARWLSFSAACLVLVAVLGCPSTAPPVAETPVGVVDIGGGVEAGITAPSSSFGVSVLEDPISVFYTIAGATGTVSVSGFYVPLESADPNGTATGTRVILETRDFTNGTDFFSFDPGAAGIGFYRPGILVSVDGVELDPVDGTTVIEVEGPPDPTFITPVDLTSEWASGDEILISFDAGDPQNEVQWRLFLLRETDPRDVPIDELGEELATGSGNTGQFILSTLERDLGAYEIGISATDSRNSIQETVAAGNASRIVTIPNNIQNGRVIQIVEFVE